MIKVDVVFIKEAIFSRGEREGRRALCGGGSRRKGKRGIVSGRSSPPKAPICFLFTKRGGCAADTSSGREGKGEGEGNVLRSQLVYGHFFEGRTPSTFFLKREKLSCITQVGGRKRRGSKWVILLSRTFDPPCKKRALL